MIEANLARECPEFGTCANGSARGCPRPDGTSHLGSNEAARPTVARSLLRAGYMFRDLVPLLASTAPS